MPYVQSAPQISSGAHSPASLNVGLLPKDAWRGMFENSCHTVEFSSPLKPRLCCRGSAIAGADEHRSRIAEYGDVRFRDDYGSITSPCCRTFRTSSTSFLKHWEQLSRWASSSSDGLIFGSAASFSRRSSLMWYSSRCEFVMAAAMMRDVCFFINHLVWLVPLPAWHRTSESTDTARLPGLNLAKF
jgi:hypothetical protein